MLLSDFLRLTVNLLRSLITFLMSYKCCLMLRNCHVNVAKYWLGLARQG
jgi:hypothetical protein